ncbi:MAG: DNA polymerase IV, partial [Lachnospiraceae bacterium]
YDILRVEDANKVLLALAETVGNRLRADEVQIEVIAVGIRYSDLSEGNSFPFVSHQKKLLSSTNLTAEIYKGACELFLDLWNGNPIRHLGIHTSKVQDESFTRQLSLFDETDYEKLARMDETVDDIRERFGMDSLMRAAFLNQPIDHMCGGISREKREVDYNKIIVQ